MLIVELILFGMLVGAGAQLILGKSAKGVDWMLAFVAGLAGSFVGGLLISLLSGDGLQLWPSGIIGSLVGALLVTAGWQWYRAAVRLLTPDRRQLGSDGRSTIISARLDGRYTTIKITNEIGRLT
jgi:uncharacterized membrane protein YeaQ/YmgE (transglycosylase-associated protein family)